MVVVAPRVDDELAQEDEYEYAFLEPMIAILV